ncbi:MAG: hypothetical protein JWM28_2449 [Chitinophagaceae bacterium]|nr:hypothetical protein [Chitinophagaceae bacterium]
MKNKKFCKPQAISYKTCSSITFPSLAACSSQLAARSLRLAACSLRPFLVYFAGPNVPLAMSLTVPSQNAIFFRCQV